ncbi:hypothetical protein E2C01_049004 [Portunus trituberculatus]|uniref:Uncharacterized protein n=1 Tax=Portunus trituberculatus TaxID=210409 RepID=A0A5B7G535_PORTR|nr:hypothetical protein [Portunus trituberculatus]
MEERTVKHFYGCWKHRTEYERDTDEGSSHKVCACRGTDRRRAAWQSAARHSEAAMFEIKSTPVTVIHEQLQPPLLLQLHSRGSSA